MLDNNPHLSTYPEIWGGIECTINRVKDSFTDQLIHSNHYERTNDIEHFASLGIKALRYPVLWEFHQSNAITKNPWDWTTQQLHIIKNNNVKPIIGLLHHGSGPRFTNLYDRHFAEQLAEYAYKVASAFPWIENYTPVNEPLTTARFSGLYGFWFPHYTNDFSFVTMLLNQLKATILAMKAIRKVNPNAKLIQTEDLTKIHSTSLLRYQADFENQRRWLTYDILCGKLNSEHPLWKYFISIGITEETLFFFIENKCAPDILGVNYYVTSERYLDEQVEKYSICTHGGNTKHKYADVEAVRVGKVTGIKKLLQEVWNRYQIPIVITEAHLSCTREEQMRWFKEVWDTSCALCKKNIPIQAVTAWSLLGSFNWNSLLTREDNYYESGVFDIRGQTLRSTALVKLIQSLSTKKAYHHPVLKEKGWWHRNDRFINCSVEEKPSTRTFSTYSQPILIIGKNGTLAQAFAKICDQRAISFKALSRHELNIVEKKDIEKIINLYKPWAVINAAGYVRVDDAETDIQNCFRINTHAPALLAEACKQHDIQFMTFSSDLVFDGNKKTPYMEEDEVQPLNIYGKSKAAAEKKVLNINPLTLLIRTSAFFGPWDQYNFAFHILNTLQEKRTCAVATDVAISPTYVPDLVHAALDIFIDEEKGVWHMSNKGTLTWADFACEIAERGGYEKKFLVIKKAAEMNWKAQRPMYSPLQSIKGIELPSFDDALHRYFKDKTYYCN